MSRFARLAAACLLLLATSLHAQTYPTRPIKLVVPFGPGGSADAIARPLAEKLGGILGQPVVVDNRPGAGGSVGGLAVTQAPADGYTLMLSNSTPISIGPFALEKQPYDPVDGFSHIALIGTAPCVVMANPAAPVKTITDVEAQARKTGRLDFGSGGPASIGSQRKPASARWRAISAWQPPSAGVTERAAISASASRSAAMPSAGASS